MGPTSTTITMTAIYNFRLLIGSNNYLNTKYLPKNSLNHKIYFFVNDKRVSEISRSL